MRQRGVRVLAAALIGAAVAIFPVSTASAVNSSSTSVSAVNSSAVVPADVNSS